MITRANNTHVLDSDVCSIPLTRGLYALVDKCDFERISKHKWHAMRASDLWYAARSVRDGKRVTKILMHREVLQQTNGFEVDHRNGFGLDNRRENLRPCTRSQNMQNQRKNPNTKKRLQYKGVARQTGQARYAARISVNGKLLWLGAFNSEIEAARAYDKAAIKHFGEFARLNFPQEAINAN